MELRGKGSAASLFYVAALFRPLLISCIIRAAWRRRAGEAWCTAAAAADKYRTLNIHTQGDYMVISLAFCALFQHHQFAVRKKWALAFFFTYRAIET
jgi:hypothetical protein